MPKLLADEVWQDLLRYWNSEEYQKLNEKRRNARATKKGGSLHTMRAISQIIVRDKMEKELGREITHEELFKETHIRKKKNQQMKISGLSHVQKLPMTNIC